MILPFIRALTLNKRTREFRGNVQLRQRVRHLQAAKWTLHSLPSKSTYMYVFFCAQAITLNAVEYIV